MGRAFIVLFLAYAFFFTLFWNVKSWKWSVTKTLLIALGCSILTTVVIVGLIFVLVMLG